MQPEAELILTPGRQDSAGGSEKAKGLAGSITFGILRGSANLLPVLSGERFWLPLREITRAPSSRVAAPHEPDTQGEPRSEGALLSRVGSFLEPAEYAGEFQEKKGAGCGGRDSSFLPQTCGPAQTED